MESKVFRLPAQLGFLLEFEVQFDLQPFRLTRGLPYARLVAEFPSIVATALSMPGI